MPEVQDRIEKLGNSILSDAQQKADEIISSTDRRPTLFTQRNYQRATLPHISRCLLTGAGL